MKKIAVITIILSFLIGGALSAAPTKEEKAAAAAAAAAAAKARAAQEARKEAEAKARAKLDAKQWAIEVTSTAAKKQKTEIDTLTFEGGKVTSKNLSEKGYPTSNYSLTLRDDGTIIWETMQTSENKEIAFWRGELKGEAMTGMLSLHSPKGQAQDCYFKAVSAESTQPVIAEPEKPAEAEKKAEPAKKEEPAKKKTKKK